MANGDPGFKGEVDLHIYEDEACRVPDRRFDVEVDALQERANVQGAIPLLTADEERRLGKAVLAAREASERLRHADRLSVEERERLQESVRAGSEAKQRLVEGSMPMVVGLARRYSWSGLPFADLVQEGVVGLLEAADRLDPDRGRFIAYASWWVRHAIADFVRRSTGTLRLPTRKRAHLRRLAEARIAQPEASWEQLASAEGIDADEASALITLLGDPVSLDAPRGDAETSLAEMIADRKAEEALERVLISADAQRLLRTAERTLTSRELDVIRARYGLGGLTPRTLQDVGDELGVTAQRVAQIESNALAKLREALRQRPAAAGVARSKRSVDVNGASPPR